jgi:hypothetical protein
MPYPARLWLTPEHVEFAVWRVWAADVRDRKGPHRHVSAGDAENAGLLTQLLDSWEQCDRRARAPNSARNLAEGLQEGIARLVGQLLLNGVQAPRLPAKRLEVG